MADNVDEEVGRYKRIMACFWSFCGRKFKEGKEENHEERLRKDLDKSIQGNISLIIKFSLSFLQTISLSYIRKKGTQNSHDSCWVFVFII